METSKRKRAVKKELVDSRGSFETMEVDMEQQLVPSREECAKLSSIVRM